MHGKPTTIELEALLNALPERHPARTEWSFLQGYLTKLWRDQQGALSVKASTNIAYGIYRNIVEDPEFDPSATEFDYEDEHHDRVRKLMKELREE